MGYVIGVDVGGTFTDSVVIEETGRREVAKASTTPAEPERGVEDSLSNLAEKHGLSLRELLSNTDVFYHGTTLVTNIVVEGEGSDVGFITTEGFRDEVHIGQTKTRTAGLSRREIQRFAGYSKPEPLADKPYIRGITERVDYKGEEIVPLDEDAARQAVRELLALDVDAIAVSLLWSFANPDHERRLEEIIEEESDGGVYTAISSEIAPKIGEYMRGATTLINTYAGPVLSRYGDRLAETLERNGLDAPVYLMQSNGGVLPLGEATNHAEQAVSSGPAAGVIGTRYIGNTLERSNIICTDVGGTSFDVGLVVDGEPTTVPEQVVNRYSLHQKAIDIESIGSGGGSIAWVDDAGHLHVGPESAGADPGPACYLDGGDRPTVTDACLLLGYLDPDYFLGGAKELDVDLARSAFEEHVAGPMDVSVDEAAAAVLNIMTNHMTDLIRKLTIERGYDPRRFDLFAYGGAGPMFASFYGFEVGVDSVIVPLSSVSPVYSAYGITTSDLTWVEERSAITLAPFDTEEINGHFADLERTATENILDITGADATDLSFEYRAEMRYEDQVKDVDIPIQEVPMSEEAVANLSEEYERVLEGRYGEGAKYSESPIQISTYHVTARFPTLNPEIHSFSDTGSAEDAHWKTREAYFEDAGGFVTTDIYDGAALGVGASIEGPAVLQMPQTTITVRPKQVASFDNYKNVLIEQR